MTRRESREAAFLLLFEWSFRDDEAMDEIIELARQCRAVTVDTFAAKLAAKTVDYVIQADHEIGLYSDKWKINRLSRVTLTVLRMSICELAYMEDIPAGATINEAVELMKKYATGDEAAYVNGVLGAYHRANCPAGDTPAADGLPERPVEATAVPPTEPAESLNSDCEA